MTHDYKAALDEMPLRDLIEGYDVKGWLADNFGIVEHALKLAHKVTADPSGCIVDAMNDALYAEIGDVTQDGLPANSIICQTLYTAAITAAEKEIEDDR